MTNKSLKQFLEKKLHKKLSDFLVFEEGIDVSVQMEFEKYTYDLLKKDEEPRSFEELDTIINNKDSDINDKKTALTELSLSGDVKAYRIIEKYKDNCDKELKKWAILAFQKSRANIEHELSDNAKVYISSGLGGAGNSLRYFFVLSANNKKDFSDFQKKLLKKEIEFALNSHDSVCEKITFHGYFVSILCLVPLHISLDSILKNILKEIENFGSFLSEEIIATNTEIFSEEKIEKLLNHDPETEKELDLPEIEGPDFLNLDDDFDDDFFDDDDDDFDDDFFDDDDDDIF